MIHRIVVMRAICLREQGIIEKWGCGAIIQARPSRVDAL
jgi:hypothetical protein